MQHPDEGTIHAWLDGALPAAEGAALEEHVARCADCAAAVAEARGMLAAASRILGALDNVPGGVVPPAAPADATRVVVDDRTRRPGARSFRFRAGRWRVAAGLMVAAVGSWLVLRADEPRAAMYGAADSVTREERVAAERPAGGQALAERAPAPAPSTVAPSRTAPSVASSAAPVPAPTVRQAQRTAAQREKSIAERREREPAPRGVEAASGAGAPAALDELQFRSLRGVVDGRQVALDAALAADSAAVRAYAAVQLGANVVAGERARVLQGAPEARRVAPTTTTAPAAPRPAADVAALEAWQPDALRGDVEHVLGCYDLTVTGWSPPAAGDRPADTRPPRRVELLREPFGITGDSAQRLVRALPAGDGSSASAPGRWVMLDRERLRLTFGAGESWHAMTLAVAPGGLRGRVRAAPLADGTLPVAEVVARRVSCTQPPPER